MEATRSASSPPNSTESSPKRSVQRHNLWGSIRGRGSAKQKGKDVTQNIDFVHANPVGLAAEQRSGHTTSITSLSSQGLVQSTDPSASCAMVHESSSPPMFYKAMYNHDGIINMDRGGFGHFATGTNYGCVYDGVTAGGVINAYAAQAFAEHTINWLRVHGHEFRHGIGVTESLSRRLFKETVGAANNPSATHRNPRYNAEGGSATGIFVAVQDISNKDYLIAHGASVGDAAALLVSSVSGTRFLSSVPPRRDGSARDTGGQLTMCMGVHGEIWPFSSPIVETDSIILCSDGLVDNIFLPELGMIVPFIINCEGFDVVPGDDCDCTSGKEEGPVHLPRMNDLLKFFDTKFDPNIFKNIVPPSTIVMRLMHYVKWVTRNAFLTEQGFYTDQVQMRSLKTEIEKLNSNHGLSEDRKADELSRINFQIKTTENSAGEAKRDKKRFSVGKTDDVCIVAFTPKHNYRENHILD